MDETSSQNQPHVVSRAQLPLPASYVAPQTPTQERLVQIWQTVLSMDVVGVEDDYYDLGGDSFLAAIIFGMITESFSIRIPMGVLMEAPSIAKLAPRIDALLSQKSTAPSNQ